MNDKNYESIIQKYIEKFNFMNNQDNDESYKWAAFAHFLEHWDIEASDDDFSSMMKEAFKKTSNLINNSRTLPASGICKLAEHDPAGVRELFKILTKADGGDIKLRQSNIETFVDEATTLMDKYIPGSWKFRQDFRVALFYLNLISPKDNYVFKATEAREFADRVSFAEDFGSGKTFSLASYYKMCDSLLAMVKVHEELLEVHRTRWSVRQQWDDSETYVDDDLHILVYDILFSALGYGLYVDVPKLHLKTKVELDRKIPRSEVEFALEQKRLELLNLEKDFKTLPVAGLLGLSVSHKIYGEGIIIEQMGEKINVEFSVGNKTFKLPDAFSIGYLQTESSADKISCVLEAAQMQDAIEKKRMEVSTILNKLKWM